MRHSHETSAHVRFRLPANDSAQLNTSTIEYPYNIEARIVMCTFSLIFLLLIVASNAFVLFVFAKERSIRRESNWFVASLAIADLLVGLFIMPQTITYTLLGYWPFGVLMCEVWLALDVLLCTASILLIVQIALDRFIALKFPLYYLSCDRSRFATALIVGAWVIAFLIALPPLVGWRPVRKDGECMLSQDVGYVLYSALGSFYIPVLSLVILYGTVLRITLQRARQLRQKLLNCREVCNNVIKPLECVANQALLVPLVMVTSESVNSDISETRLRDECFTAETSIGMVRKSSGVGPADTGRNPRFQEAVISMKTGKFLLPISPKVSTDDGRLPPGSRRRSTRFVVFERRLQLLKEKERQSVTMLGTIILTFVGCWLPFFLIYVLEAFGYKAPPLIFDAFFLLGYYNSAMNPLIYGVLNEEFKAAFRKTLRRLTFGRGFATSGRSHSPLLL